MHRLAVIQKFRHEDEDNTRSSDSKCFQRGSNYVLTSQRERHMQGAVPKRQTAAFSGNIQSGVVIYFTVTICDF